jgi:zinc and cadmium transporter
MPVLVACAAVLFTALGGFVALRANDRLHLILGFAAGVMLGLVAFDLIPELFELSDAQVAGVPAVMVAFAAGFLLLHFVERSVAMHGAHEGEYEPHHHHNPSVGLASAGALVAHSFLDGVGIGLAFQIDNQVGIAVAVAVIAHDFADGLNTVTIMRTHGNGRRRTLTMLAADAVAPVVGAFSTLFFSVSDELLALYLGAFAGFLLYLATADILPEAHARHPSRLTLVSTLAGLGLMWFVVAAS